MRWTIALVAALSAARALAGPIGAGDPQAASPTGFPGAYLGTVALSLEADPRYGPRLLDALDTHLQAVCVMTSPREVADYLEQSAGGSEGAKSLRRALGREPLDTMKSAALLLADALARPEQLREVLEGLESQKPGVGRHAADLLRGARGTGEKKLIAALREAGERRGGKTSAPYYSGGRLAVLFDAASIEGRDGVVLEEPSAEVRGAGSRPGARPRAPDARPARP